MRNGARIFRKLIIKITRRFVLVDPYPGFKAAPYVQLVRHFVVDVWLQIGAHSRLAKKGTFWTVERNRIPENWIVILKIKIQRRQISVGRKRNVDDQPNENKNARDECCTNPSFLIAAEIERALFQQRSHVTEK